MQKLESSCCSLLMLILLTFFVRRKPLRILADCWETELLEKQVLEAGNLGWRTFASMKSILAIHTTIRQTIQSTNYTQVEELLQPRIRWVGYTSIRHRTDFLESRLRRCKVISKGASPATDPRARSTQTPPSNHTIIYQQAEALPRSRTQ